jgi:hypothetical protein
MKRRQIVAKFLWFWWKYKFKFVDADWYYGSQCIDRIRQYCKEVYSYNMPSLDKARNLSSRQFPKDKRYEIEVWIDWFQMWDIVAVDLIPKNEYWHIFIMYKQTKEWYWYIDQNGIWWAFRNWKVNNIKWNGVEKRFAKRNTFKILRAFRYA